MRLVVQRVRSASVEVGDETVGNIGPGLVILWGIQSGDTWVEADYCIRKCLNMKLWNEDTSHEQNCRESGTKLVPAAGSGKTWAQSVRDKEYEILVVSQFTLFGSLKAGNKPDFHNAMPAGEASKFFSEIVDKMRKQYRPDRICTGAFGQFMQVSLVNDGPVTIVLEQQRKGGEDQNRKGNQGACSPLKCSIQEGGEGRKARVLPDDEAQNLTSCEPQGAKRPLSEAAETILPM